MDALQKSGHVHPRHRLSQESLDHWMQSSALIASLSVAMLVAIVVLGGLVSHSPGSMAKKGAAATTELSSSSKPEARDVAEPRKLKSLGSAPTPAEPDR